MLRLRETSEINRDKVVGGKRNVLREGKEAKTKGEKKKKKNSAHDPPTAVAGRAASWRTVDAPCDSQRINDLSCFSLLYSNCI